MKRMISIVVLLILMVSFAVAGHAEDYISRYEDMLNGSWTRICYSGISDASYNSTCTRIKEFSYPDCHMTIDLRSNAFSGTSETDGVIVLTGDDSGRVFITLINYYDTSKYNSSVQAISCGEASFSADGTVLIVRYDDNGFVMYQK